MEQITLKAARTNAGYTLETAANELRIGADTLGRYEKDCSKMKLGTFVKVCKLYGCPMSSIILGKE